MNKTLTDTPTTSITVRRPDGTVETVDTTARFRTLSERGIQAIAEATREAGRGEVIGYTTQRIDIGTPLTDPKGLCPRCGTYCNGDCRSN